MMEIGVQTKNVVTDEAPLAGYRKLKAAGFDCADFSLNDYWRNHDIYNDLWNGFFDQSKSELEEFFLPHRLAAEKAGIRLNQMHMPYPLFVPKGSAELNEYLRKEVAPKSLYIGSVLGIRYIVVHGFRVAKELGSEMAEWQETEKFLRTLAPLAKELKMTICLENIYSGVGNHIIEGPCSDAKLAAERIDRLNDEYQAEVFGFCFDTGHANLLGMDAADFLVALGDRLSILHIHDNDGISDLHQMPYTFTRTRDNAAATDWGNFLYGLRQINFNGVLSFETAPVLESFPEELKLDALSLIAKIGRYFQAEIERPIY